MHDRLFLPQGTLDEWVSEKTIELTEDELVIQPGGFKYRIVDALRVVQEVSGIGDFYGIVGKVKTVNFLTELGAELLGTSMLIGESAYDVVPGFLALPVSPGGYSRAGFKDGLGEAPLPRPSEPATEEGAIVDHLIQGL